MPASLLPFTALDLYSVITGFACVHYVRILGVFAVGEVLMAIALPFFILNFGLPTANKRARNFLLMSFFLAAAITLSCLLNRTPFELALRGIMRPVFLMVITGFFYFIIKKKPAAVLMFWAGYAIGNLPSVTVALRDANSLLQLSNVNSDSFIYNVSNFLIAASILVSYALWRISPSFAACFAAFLSAYSLLQGARGVAIVYFLSAVTYALSWLATGIQHQRKQSSLGMALLLCTTLLLGGYASFRLYKFAVSDSILRKSELSKFEQQTQTRFGDSAAGIIAGARPELIVCLYGIAENPVLGIGSWPDVSAFKRKAYDYVGIPEPPQNTRLRTPTNRSSGHSMILGEWMQHGLTGLAYWLYVYYMLMACLTYCTKLRQPIASLFITPLYYGAWAIMFSPWGLLDRLTICLCIAGAMDLWKYSAAQPITLLTTPKRILMQQLHQQLPLANTN